ncbi:kinesin motor domain-containing protein [Thecamonas trahens ATCC 50062]|uniref:Kinesin-like protein n=1 Tax=Thecamonas trahens ATCC 50062 TaxID=461836 RepID=A0A0L0DD76_THETB|nr:kinesin motor domain-containing protein [Thecamonas trahens ATCC 50062]KNC50056.1 kinesin motor domain-containing protein [Thecamonas trahens ATCC 50062]|eukprot:XP_013757221.1 kinesin motor domain-containing protein [Thecamonas trahens ATCC 50062]
MSTTGGVALFVNLLLSVLSFSLFLFTLVQSMSRMPRYRAPQRKARRNEDYRPSTAPATLKARPGNNITVAVRVRPPTRRESAAYGSVVKVHPPDSLVFDGVEADRAGVPAHVRGAARNKAYTFDAVFGDNTGTAEVFAMTLPLLDDVLAGVNACVFAYGATGAGKTYTMAGTPSEPGVMVRMVEHLLQRMAVADEAYELSISYLEIYNEKIFDLLVPSSGPLPLRADGKGGVTVAGMSSHNPRTIDQVMQLLDHGNANRTQAPTDVNATSSRSHALFEITVTSPRHVGKMTLIDLAGSERASKTNNRGVRLREGAKINRSLLALGGCIRALCDGSSHVPFRNSKLTRMLADSLGGSSRTVVLACVAPTASSYEDTFNTLHYCERMKKVRKRKAVSNARNLAPADVIAALRAEIAELKAAGPSRSRQRDASRLDAFRAQIAAQAPANLDSPMLPPHMRRIVSTAAAELASPSKRDLVKMAAANVQLKLEITKLRAVVHAGQPRSPSASPAALTASLLNSPSPVRLSSATRSAVVPGAGVQFAASPSMVRLASASPSASGDGDDESDESTLALRERPFTSAGVTTAAGRDASDGTAGLALADLSATSLSPIDKRGSVLVVNTPRMTPPPRKRRVIARKRIGRRKVVTRPVDDNKENSPMTSLEALANWQPPRKPRMARVGQAARARGGVWK